MGFNKTLPIDSHLYAKSSGDIADLLIRALLMSVFIGVWVWIIFFPLDFGHRDEIALLTEFINAQIFSGRFFPLGHIEFNFIGLEFFRGNLQWLYVLPFFQLVLFVFFVEKIISPRNNFVRLYALCASFWLAAIVPFTQLIVPERNALFFMLISLLCYQSVNKNPRLCFVLFGVLFSSISLYYKEPVFVFWFVFSLIMCLYRFSSLRQKARVADEPVSFLGSINSIDFGVFVSSFLFLLGYFFFVFYNGSPDSYYAGVSNYVPIVVYLKRFLYFTIDVPILSVLIFVALAAHLFMPKLTFERSFSVALAGGGVFYLCAMAFLGLPLNGYYYSIPFLLMTLSSAMLLNCFFSRLSNSKFVIKNVRLRHSLIFVLCFSFVSVQGFLLYKQSNIVFGDLLEKKNIQSEYNFLRSEFKKVSGFESLYYSPRFKEYGEYNTAILMTFLHKTGVSHDFRIYSESGCNDWNKSYNSGRIICGKKVYNKADSYDIVLIENESVAFDMDNNQYTFLKFTAPYQSKKVARRSFIIAIRNHN